MSISERTAFFIAENAIRLHSAVSRSAAGSALSAVCKCRREEQEEYDRKMAEMDRRSHIRSLKASGLQERALYDWKFENAADSASIQMTKHYVTNWKEAKKNNLGLLLGG